MEYELIRSDRKTLGAQIKDGRLIIRAPLRATKADIDRFLEKHRAWVETHLAESREKERAKAAVPRLTPEELRALADRALEVIPRRAAYYAPLVGVQYGRITIRNQRTRWGSCSGKRNLNFNCLLMLAPPQVLDSVIVHELCHRIEMNHSGRFYEEVLRVFPDYWKWHGWLGTDKENDWLTPYKSEPVPINL